MRNTQSLIQIADLEEYLIPIVGQPRALLSLKAQVKHFDSWAKFLLSLGKVLDVSEAQKLSDSDSVVLPFNSKLALLDPIYCDRGGHFCV